MEKFKGTVYKCQTCGHKLQSRYSGDFQMCKCGEESFVDQTRHYTRLGGKAVLDESENNENKNQNEK